jgi:hypothetical protein
MGFSGKFIGLFRNEMVNEAGKEEMQTDYTITSRQSGSGCLITSTMSQEQLRIRRMNLIEGTKFGRPFHENFMLVFLRIWLVIAPILFVALTSSEVAYILTHLVPANDKNGTFIIWAGAIFIDVAMIDFLPNNVEIGVT